ncbi:hypothetical protein L207DRAFT_486623 [Hyaloscypha variabilis F]|jgi:hypothetical protein|uniref:Thioesterase/thiol ester dehydrase-isomerase n=1 Tax=Hyaloscypha variabilis (strain UAMH 11265 / GT02V1 / F) TaxID=1149755 RepID=A0A2J6RWF4_HYAVF|nr:hypothetical protein L207DRAFT_486623 [Hyaloscypha variabilis F]
MACKFTIRLKHLPQSLTIKQFRFLRAFIYQVFVHREPLPSDALFRPLIVTTRNWPAECDYNIHKSNSTYFTDMDIARAHLVSCLLKNWLRGSNSSSNSSALVPNNLKLDGSKRVSIAVGAVSCHFRKEIPPFTKYEIWTRILCWDKKWIYIVCHFVKCGAVPLGQRSSPETRHTTGNASATKTSTITQIDPPSSAIYATGITRYVFKEGRITVPPELFLSTCGLLPPRQVLSEINVTDLRREMIEEQNERGLKYMEAFATLDEVHESFKDSTSKEALGHFGEF